MIIFQQTYLIYRNNKKIGTGTLWYIHYYIHTIFIPTIYRYKYYKRYNRFDRILITRDFKYLIINESYYFVTNYK